MGPDPLLAHILARLEADVRFLADQGRISQSDAQTVLGVVSRAGSSSAPVNEIASGMSGMGLRSAPSSTPSMPNMPMPFGGGNTTTTPAPAAPAPYGGPPAPASYGNSPPPAFPGGPPAGGPLYAGAASSSPAPVNSALRRPVPPPPPAGVQAKALWDYNLNGQLGDDLAFRSGDIIQIVKEENPDWWTGRLNGKEGMFPSNHVEKLPNTPSAAPSYAPAYGAQSYENEKQQQMYAPPPGPPIPYQQPGPVQQGPPPNEEEKKKGKFGKYGGMMAGSAAGGLGFGAGAAVGSGLINAIF